MSSLLSRFLSRKHPARRAETPPDRPAAPEPTKLSVLQLEDRAVPALYFQSGFENTTDPFIGWDTNLGGQVDTSPGYYVRAAVDQPKREGSKAAKFSIQRNATNVDGPERSEVRSTD